jgi:hypothetical protein
MKSLKFIIVATAAIASIQAMAAPKPMAADAMMTAEHAQWTADHDRWHAQHLDLAKRLEAAAAQLRSPDVSFSDHGKELQAHSAVMAKGDDAAALAAAHARLASEHEDARLAHHELVDDVMHIEMLVRDDRDTEARENPMPR